MNKLSAITLLSIVVWWQALSATGFMRCSQPLRRQHHDQTVQQHLLRRDDRDDDIVSDNNSGVDCAGRRLSLKQLLGSLSLSPSLMIPMPAAAAAASERSRTEGYAIQKTDDEWKQLLSERQYQILRQGGTERQYSSVLEEEERDGTYHCAGCGTALFSSADKFHSGTGWPSFAATVDKGVEVENVNIFQAKLGGAELRCKTCGGHLGDVFEDGWIFTGTRAAETGKRFCIDGSALVFKPSDGSSQVVGDRTPPNWEQKLFP
mmetsp:Transcript_12649/g.30667  ORF Transcript_12649/g.30667 Transcript_12649/m.30667 type:complete len:262 (+) Transcript_12649:57-842(+)